MKQADYERIKKKLDHLGKYVGCDLKSDQVDLYIDALARFSDKVLVAGFKHLSETHKYNYYPKLPQILQACSEAPSLNSFGVSNNMNFMQPSNGEVCDCGMHHGSGINSPHERARVYAWYREKYTQGYDAHKQKYLETYETAHGHVEPNV